ncbi:unnamed protein product [Closterium sp. Yama58-4]|nr:unnamed protein product [Closterium sp. Yama58-4]
MASPLKPSSTLTCSSASFPAASSLWRPGRGPYTVKRGAFLLKRRRFLLKTNPPRPLRIWSPKTASATAMPVLLFQHGFSAQTSFYSQLLTRIAKHGYIVVAPQMYPVTTGYNTAPEMRGSANVIGWMRKRLAKVLANRLEVKAIPDWDKFAISGHSRGGKVAFGVARGLVKKSPVTIGAVILVDPVDGASNKTKNYPATLTHRPGSISLGIPVLVIGAGLGPIPEQPGGMPCAPAYFGHKFFYSDLADSAYHVVMPRYGHADFNNDMRVTVNVCPGGPKKKKARAATAGLVVAFLKAKLESDSSDLDDVLANPGHAPVTLSPVESK